MKSSVSLALVLSWLLICSAVKSQGLKRTPLNDFRRLVTKCVSKPDQGFICPDDLPDVPNVKLVCSSGCYLLSPAKAREAWGALKKVALIPELQDQIKDLQLQRDTAIADLEEYSDTLKAQLWALQACEEVSSKKYELSTVIYVAISGAAIGAIGVLIALHQ